LNKHENCSAFIFKMVLTPPWSELKPGKLRIACTADSTVTAYR